MARPGWLAAFLVLLPATILVGIFLPRSWAIVWAWLIILGCMIGMFGFIGLSRGMNLLGILIDAGRNMMSLSRLQIVLWTCVILSAFLTVALGRIGDYARNPSGYECPPPAEAEDGAPAADAEGGETAAEPECAEPLGIQLPLVLWGLMGISMTSAVASPLLKANKTQRTAEQDRIQEAKGIQTPQAAYDTAGRVTGIVTPSPAVTYSAALEQRRAVSGSAVAVEAAQDSVGVMVRKKSWRNANLADLFTGEEVDNFGYVDMAKVQNFFFTVIAIVSYAVMLGVAMAAAGTDVAGFFVFPDPTESLLAILGISHAGYLVDKPFVHSTPA